MERRFLVIRSADTKDNQFFSNILQQFSDLLKICSSEEILGDSVLGPAPGASFSLPPHGSWQTSSEVSTDLGDVYSHSPDSLTDLATSVHELLDSLPPPGTFSLCLLWVCDAPPSAPAPQLYGALQRARAWHGASLTLVTRAQVTPPGWLSSLRAEVVSEADLDEDIGLTEFLSPYQVWRGSLAFQVDPLSKVKLPGFELHLDQDDIQTIIQRVNPQPHKTRMTKRYFSPEMEVVTSVPVSSVLAQPQYLTGQSLELKVPVLDHDELSESFMADLGDSGMGYILKLKYSSDKGEYDMNLLKTEHWKQSVINCNFSLECPCPVLGVDVSSVNILVLDDPREDTDCARATLKKYGIVLKNTCDLNKLYSFQQPFSQNTINIEEMEKVVSGISQFNIDDNFTKLKGYVKRVQIKVLLVLKEENSELLVNERVEDILVSIQEEILNKYEAFVDKRKIDKSDTDKVIAQIQTVGESKRANSSEDWQELRFLNYLATISEKEEEERAAQSKLLKPSEEEFVVLEAKELIKYFDVNGLPAKSLEEVEIKKKICPLRPQKSPEDYISMRDKHFTEIPNTDFSFKGFRFNEDKDFSTIEFTQFHDVYYNTGLVAEDFDTECKNYRDCMVGPHRETMSTFSSGTSANTRVKLVTRRPSEKLDKNEKNVKPERRVSPRKKPVLKNVTDKNMQVRRKIAEKSRLDTSKNSDKGDARRKSGGEPPAPGELSEMHKKKLRIAVYDALHRNKVDEKNPLFKKCFPKLFQICKMYVLEGFDDNRGSATKFMSDVAMMNAKNVIDLEKMMLSKRKK